ncbi:MAG: Asp-tRNA(Asn)/Glu-tRNA(Gln) amidotransferase subunit GatB [Candidatus Nanoarchaeia archaeon]
MEQVKIGLEIHGYLDTKEKLFCMCRAVGEDNEKPNSRICPICTGQPGSKPMLPNEEAIKKIIQIGLVLGCKINTKPLTWYRKHYSWPDLPKGYQNTISGAHADFPVFNGTFKGIKIRECHLEEDPAQWNPDTGKVNYNRSGLPLIEIVTEPDFSSSEEVVNWLGSLLHSLSYIKAIKRDAGIKADVNISTGGERVEIKNINSIENIKHAINYEVARQLEEGAERETRAYSPEKGKTIKMRSKEQQADYRFVSDPDLPSIILDEKMVNQLKKQMPEMPEQKLDKLIKQYKINEKDAEILARNIDLVEFVEELAKHLDVSQYISWVTIELLRVLNYNKLTLEEVDIKPEHLVELLQAVDKKKLTPLKAKEIMNKFVPKSYSIRNEVGSLGREEVEKICKQVIKENEKAVNDYKQGEKQALNFLIGQVMKKSDKRADFAQARECLLGLL